MIQYADAQLISVNNTTLNIPITVIVPITLEIQNAQICATVASSGGQSCQQIVLNPTQSAFTPVNVDLANPTTPTVTTLSGQVPTTQQLTGSPAAAQELTMHQVQTVTNNTVGALTNTLGAVTNNTVGALTNNTVGALTNNTLGTVVNNTSSGTSGSNNTSGTSSGNNSIL